MCLFRSGDWVSRFTAVVEQYDGAPWEWGRSDCLTFAADACRALTGKDPIGRFRGRYRSRFGAAVHVRRMGCRSVGELVEALAREARMPVIPTWAARVGDIGVTADDVVCVRLPRGFAARAEDGTFREASAVRAWAVG